MTSWSNLLFGQLSLGIDTCEELVLYKLYPFNVSCFAFFLIVIVGTLSERKLQIYPKSHVSPFFTCSLVSSFSELIWKLASALQNLHFVVILLSLLPFFGPPLLKLKGAIGKSLLVGYNFAKLSWRWDLYDLCDDAASSIKGGGRESPGGGHDNPSSYPIVEVKGEDG